MIRSIKESDSEAIIEIFRSIIEKKDSYVFTNDIKDEEIINYWYKDSIITNIYEENGKVLGFYKIKNNLPYLGSHIANASYCVSYNSSGKGIGYKLGLHSITQARQLGYHAMQFNAVVSTNTNAVKLWKKLGFIIVGTVPNGFNSKVGYVDLYIMYQSFQ